jgi:hypothetical protein
MMETIKSALKWENFPHERKIFKPKAGVLQEMGKVISVGTDCFDEHGQEVVYASLWTRAAHIDVESPFRVHPTSLSHP